MTIDHRDFSRIRTDQSSPRRRGIHLRARLNECIVTLNIVWERAWHGDQFVWEDLYADDDPFRLQNMTSSLLELLHPAGRSEQEDALVVLMRPRVALLQLAAIDLSGPVVSAEPLSELAQRIDVDLARVIGDHPTRASSYQAACIHARRYVVYTELARQRDESGVHEAGLVAQRRAVEELSEAVQGSPANRDWARKDPAFKHLMQQSDFRRVLSDDVEPPGRLNASS